MKTTFYARVSVVWKSWQVRMCSHPICARRGWRVRHLKPKTQTLQTRNGSANHFQHLRMSSFNHPIILTPLWPSVQLSVETVTHNTTITSQTRTLEHIRPRPLWVEVWLKSEPEFLRECALVLTELALLGLGHGRPVPGPLEEQKLSLDTVFRLIYIHTNFKKSSHVYSWHTRTHGVVWRPHPTTEVLSRQPTKES